MSEAKYRFEQSKTARAVCRNSACKKAGIKIEKNEFRVGTFVEIQDHASWHWKHWGCVTPLQLENLQGQLEGLDLDNDDDMDVIDGWDLLTPENRDLLREALKCGHVGDDVWKGDPLLNRPGQKGINRRSPKKKAAAADEEEDIDKEPAKGDEAINEANTKPKHSKIGAKRQLASMRARKYPTLETDDEDSEIEDIKHKPKKAKKTAKVADADADEKPSAPAKKSKKATKATADSDDEAPLPAKKSKKSAKAVAADIDGEDSAPVKKSKKATKPVVEVNAEADEVEPAPAKKATKARGTKAKASVEDDPMSGDEEPAPKTKRGRKRARADEVSDEAEPAPARKAKGKGKAGGRKSKV